MEPGIDASGLIVHITFVAAVARTRDPSGTKSAPGPHSGEGGYVECIEERHGDKNRNARQNQLPPNDISFDSVRMYITPFETAGVAKLGSPRGTRDTNS